MKINLLSLNYESLKEYLDEALIRLSYELDVEFNETAKEMLVIKVQSWLIEENDNDNILPLYSIEELK